MDNPELDRVRRKFISFPPYDWEEDVAALIATASRYDELHAAYTHVAATREQATKEIMRLESRLRELAGACKAVHNVLLTFEQLGLLQQPHEQQALDLVRAALQRTHLDPSE